MKCLLACLSLHRFRCDRTGEKKAKMALHRKRGALAELSSPPVVLGSWTQLQIISSLLLHVRFLSLKSGVWLLSVQGSRTFLLNGGWVVNGGWSCLRNQGRMKLGTRWQDKFGKNRVKIQFLPPSALMRTEPHWAGAAPVMVKLISKIRAPQQYLLPFQPNISPAPKTPRVRDPKTLPAAKFQQSRCAPASPLGQGCLWDPLHWQSRAWRKSTKIGSRCETWIFLEGSSIFTLCREWDRWMEWGRDKDLADFYFRSRWGAIRLYFFDQELPKLSPFTQFHHTFFHPK